MSLLPRDPPPPNPYVRALGYASLAIGPILLGMLMVAQRREINAAFIEAGLAVAWLVGLSAYIAAVLRERGARQASRSVALFTTLCFTATLSVLGWLAWRS